MKRSGFKRHPPPARIKPVYAPITEQRAVLRRADGNDRATVAVPKSVIRRSEKYRRWVASLNCAHCGRVGFSQAAHADAGKGMALKADDGTCFPLCAESPGSSGCHVLFGASGQLGKTVRRHLEWQHGFATRELARETGHWPKTWGDE